VALADPAGASLHSWFTRGEMKAEGSSITEDIGVGRITGTLEGFTPDHAFRIEIALMRLLDRRGAIAFVDVASGEGACPIDRAELLARFHAREDGRMVSGAEAFAAMWRAIPVLRPLGLMARNRAVLAAMERLYLAFLRVRPRLQGWLKGREGAAG
jgi:predicted DCC family thiol-disulfide oxidoreductase YuxK